MNTNLVTLLYSGPIFWASFQILSFVLFRQKLAGNATSIFITSIILSIVAGLLEILEFGALIAVVQPLALILCFILLMRYHWTHAIIMISITYSICGIIELFVFSINSVLTQIPVLQKYTNNNFSLNLYVACFELLVASILQYFRFGFTFINRKHKAVGADSLKKIIVALSIINLALQGSISMSLFSNFPSQYVYLIIFIVIIVMIVMLQMYYRKELEGN